MNMNAVLSYSTIAIVVSFVIYAIIRPKTWQDSLIIQSDQMSLGLRLFLTACAILVGILLCKMVELLGNGGF